MVWIDLDSSCEGFLKSWLPKESARLQRGSWQWFKAALVAKLFGVAINGVLVSIISIFFRFACAISHDFTIENLLNRNFCSNPSTQPLRCFWFTGSVLAACLPVKQLPFRLCRCEHSEVHTTDVRSANGVLWLCGSPACGWCRSNHQKSTRRLGYCKVHQIPQRLMPDLPHIWQASLGLNAYRSSPGTCNDCNVRSP